MLFTLQRYKFLSKSQLGVPAARPPSGAVYLAKVKIRCRGLRIAIEQAYYMRV